MEIEVFDPLELELPLLQKPHFSYPKGNHINSHIIIYYFQIRIAIFEFLYGR